MLVKHLVGTFNLNKKTLNDVIYYRMDFILYLYEEDSAVVVLYIKFILCFHLIYTFMHRI